ncbi:hypothetical protein GGX14DRAFT_427306 [Mycena pura]|uniref:Cupin type-2 domain-containing protein n=1 Tax=Mycena pura TaxID=153505 RepID=A0AAD6YLU1_9AGAR|nr:hypothetical protein GGX14DRAFT_427306 [Mycena pura]
MSTSPFPPVRRVVTGHNAAGKSTALVDAVQPAQFRPGDPSPFYDLHYTGESPARIDSEIAHGRWVDEIQAHPHPELCGPHGSTFRCCELAPGEVTPAHRTMSLDYAIVFRGTITLELEDGERLTLHEGDTIVQRGTLHTWRNETTEWAKMYFVMLGANPIEINGKKLEEEFHKADT